MKQTSGLATAKQPLSKNKQIEKMYNHKDAKKEEFQKIQRPIAARFKIDKKIIRISAIVLAVVLTAVVLRACVFKDGKNNTSNQAQAEEKWWSVKLVNGEIFYGQIGDVASDPLVIKNIYYDYDQIKKKEGMDTQNASANLRLVKRGKEAHGPNGVINIVRAQVLYMEQLKDDSKVLQAIMGYESK